MRPFYKQAVSDLDPYRSMHRAVLVAHSSFIEGSHMTKNTASDLIVSSLLLYTEQRENKEISRCMSHSYRLGIAHSKCGRTIEIVVYT